ncbi:MAG: chromate transporter [Eubacteriales bacterium]|nr:chromate transporter [Eubacteriales bacterium]
MNKEKIDRNIIKKCWILFTSMLQISSFTFGGGFVIVTLMKKRFVDELKWVDDQEMLDMTALAQTSPGAIAVNAAILVGWRAAGFAGMVSAVLGTIIPPIVILSIVSYFYSKFVDNVIIAKMLKGMQAGVVAVILSVVCEMLEKLIKLHSITHILVFAGVFVAVMFYNVNVVYIILLAALFGIAIYLYNEKMHKNEAKHQAGQIEKMQEKGEDK